MENLSEHFQTSQSDHFTHNQLVDVKGEAQL